jgi:hypothetical protein
MVETQIQTVLLSEEDFAAFDMINDARRDAVDAELDMMRTKGFVTPTKVRDMYEAAELAPSDVAKLAVRGLAASCPGGVPAVNFEAVHDDVLKDYQIGIVFKCAAICTRAATEFCPLLGMQAAMRTQLAEAAVQQDAA